MDQGLTTIRPETRSRLASTLGWDGDGETAVMDECVLMGSTIRPALRPTCEARRLARVQAPDFATRPAATPAGAQWRAQSVFSGGGGLDLGFLHQGIGTQAAYDADADAVSAYGWNLPGDARQVDLTCVTPAAVPADIFLAGAPCQGFSTVGKRDVGDPRNELLMRAADLALASRCKVIVVENVPAALSGPHRVLWEAVEAKIRNGGYNVRRVLLDGRDTGVPQRRRRLFLLCWKGSDCLRVELASSAPITVREALAGIEGTEGHDVIWPEPGCRDWSVARHIPPGHRLSSVRSSERAVPAWLIPEVFGAVSSGERQLLAAVALLRRRNRRRKVGDGDPVRPEDLDAMLGRNSAPEIARLVEADYLRMEGRDVELRNTYNGRYRRLCWDDLSPTVDTKFGRAALFLHPEQHRGMTPREAARLQGFPDSYKLFGVRAKRYVVVGNAVPPPMAAHLAAFIRDAILKA